MTHSLDIRVYYEDTDADGIVFHPNFLSFCERGRTEFLHDLGFTNTSLKAEYGTVFVVRHIEADYLKPALFEERLRIKTGVRVVKNSSLVMAQSIYHLNDKDEEAILFEMDVTLVCVNADTKKAVRIPEVLRNEFKTFLEG